MAGDVMYRITHNGRGLVMLEGRRGAGRPDDAH